MRLLLAISIAFAATAFAAETKKPAKPKEEVRTSFIPEKGGQQTPMVTKDQCEAIKKKKGKYPGACKIHGLSNPEPKPEK